MTSIFHANGKLLLTAEYFVLDGALALALPVRQGQSLELNFRPEQKAIAENGLHWQSFDEQGELWFEAGFRIETFEILRTSDSSVARRLQSVLQEARKLNPSFPPLNSPLTSVCCRLDFPLHWGLGTSSTLVYLVAQWAGVDPFELQFRTFGGSGYDIACAGAESPLLYFLDKGKPRVEACTFYPTFSNSLYFIYLGKKQDSRKGIAQYREAVENQQFAVKKISLLTKEFLVAATLTDFERLILEHERIVSETVKLPRAKELFFEDYWGEIKSLGAWGGDFVLVTSHRSETETRRYFNEKGFDVFIPYNELAIGNPEYETR